MVSKDAIATKTALPPVPSPSGRGVAEGRGEGTPERISSVMVLVATSMIDSEVRSGEESEVTAFPRTHQTTPRRIVVPPTCRPQPEGWWEQVL